MKNTYDTLEFNQIRNKVEAFCISSLAKDKIETLQPYQDLEDLKLDQKYLDQAMCLIYKYGRLPMGYYNDVEPLLLKANKDGTLFGEDFVQIVYLLNNVKEIINYLSDKEIKENELVNLCNQFILPKQLLKEINRCIDSSGNVLDNASKELRRIRRQILSIEANIRTKIEQVKAANKDYLSQEAISSRNNHLVLPVKAGNKNIVKGIVHAVSATGQTMFIEPEIIVSMNNQLVHARDDELREINRILTELSRMVKDNYDLLHENQELIVEIDVIFAKAGYGVQIDGVVPEVCENYSSFSLIKARHPLIDKDKVVANSIILNEPKRMLLISGSNTGGKTVVLKTAGLLSLMALCGMAVPCNQAVVPMFDQICVDLGDEQSIEQSLSTFSSHMKRLVEITNDVSEKSLVLLDEIGSGTDPKEGQSIAEAILRYLHKVNPLIVASTHYSGLKEFAKNEEYILVAAVEFDQEKMIPTYRLIEGSVGNSYAIEISSRLGLKEEIVELAYQIKENSLTDSDKLLEKLQDELTQVQLERDRLELLTNEAKNKMNRYERLINNFEKQKDELIENAKQQANQLLEDSKQEIDLVVEELKKQAELKQHVVIEAKRNLDLLKHEEKKILNKEKHAYQVGDIVKVLSANRQGEILSINKKGILTISMSGLKLNAKPEEVIFVSKKIKPKKVKSNLKSLRKSTNQSYELNIIGKRYEEAMLLVDKFLDDALVNNYSMVRIIHGIGTGVLRNGVKKMLEKNNNVVSYRDGGPNEGGLGATLVYFE
ncbi:endonuclease MutS2 [Thomasclavelia cocleata]|jgi:DNA mismatch repair protein MutS2|uniref:endonuclease MutS2 n=1 Tax=Thomasclavelia cocleata TaxID=69824 RepID=UPI0024309EA0|nr:endonuclease MutS2 [Thomasclavelia cocleata]MCI9629685.1 endonuclease MutS2 [Thomasclavelia cocleata]